MLVWCMQQQLARNQGLIAYRIDTAFELTGDAPPEHGVIEKIPLPGIKKAQFVLRYPASVYSD